MSFAPKTQDSTHNSRSLQHANEQGGGAFFEGIQTKQDPFADKADKPGLFFQPKLDIHPAQDAYEVEADRVADQVVASTPIIAPPVQMQQNEEEDAVQSKPLVDNISRINGAKKSTSTAQRLPAFLSSGEQEHSSDAQGALQGKGEMSTPPDHFEQDLASSKGGGSELPDATRQQMESGFGADFGSVKVHTDSNAVQMSQDIGAQAFTHGNDIYFNQGKFQPGTSEGDHLLAHELTHTVQQGGGVQQKRIQRNGTTPAATGDVFNSPTQKGKVTRSGNTFEIEVAKIKLPDFKLNFTETPFTLPQTARENQQIQDWENQFTNSGSLSRHIQNKIGEAPRPIVNGTLIYAFKAKNSRGDRTNYLIGTADELKARIIRPVWDKEGNVTQFHVDHKHEFQLGGEDRDVNNLWLLEGAINVASGTKINEEKYKKIQELIDEAHDQGGFWQNGKPLAQAIKNSSRYTIKFKDKEGGLRGVGSFNENKKYTAEDIRRGVSLEGLEPLTSRQITNLGLNNENNILLFSRRDGGKLTTITYSNRQAGARDIELWRGANIRAKRLNITKNENGIIQPGSSITGDVFALLPSGRRRFIRKWEYIFDVMPMTGIPNAGYIDYSRLSAQFQQELNDPHAFEGLSPVQLDQADIEDEKGLVARGQILPSVPFLQNANIDLVIDGHDIYLEKTFTAEQINIPAPFEITNAGLTVRAGTRGLEATGMVNFEIQRVGQGFVEGFIGTDGQMGLRGSFDFDSNLFTRARIGLGYVNGVFSAEGEIGIGPGKVRGIREATVQVHYSEGVLRAEGNAQLDIRGLQQGTLSLLYSNNEFTIGGAFQLTNEIPRLQSGSVQAQVTRRADAEGYEVSASGNAVFDIPGINNASLNVNYVNGALTIEGEMAYSRDRLSGQIRLGATNLAVGDDGQPTGQPTERFRIYGGGSLTLRITPWLQATAGVRILPNGEIEVQGRIELPSSVDVFDRKSIERTLFRMPTLEIPLFAIPLGPRSLGLVARITGSLDFSAGIGPGQIQQLFGEVTYNPSHPEQTSLRGGGRFVIPADAGLTLRADAGLGISAAIASLSGGIELVGTVGLQGEAAAQVEVNWNPQTGLEINANGSIMVTPKFRFDANLFARASLDLLVTELSETWRYNLASFEYGPDLRFGINFPIHYVEGQPFDVSFDDIEVIAPEVNIADFVRGIGREIKDRVF